MRSVADPVCYLERAERTAVQHSPVVQPTPQHRCYLPQARPCPSEVLFGASAAWMPDPN